MDQNARAKWFADLNAGLAGAYKTVASLLARLPIPMQLPQRQADDPAAAINAMSRAWELAEWEPFSRTVRRQVRGMITDWLTAYELAVAAHQHGPALWRLNGMEAALGRVRAGAEIVAGFLGNELQN